MQELAVRLRPIALAITLITAVPHAAQALTLADLDAGGSFDAGPIAFSGFEISLAGDLSADLSAYPVQLLADGFRLAGPLTVLLGERGTLLLSYVVETAANVFVDGAALFAPLVAIDSGAAALVSESLLGPGGVPLGALLALDLAGGNPAVTAASTGFAGTTRLEVVTVVALRSGLLAAAPHVDQRFSTVPEPLTVFLLAGGLIGLTFSGRRRAEVALRGAIPGGRGGLPFRRRGRPLAGSRPAGPPAAQT